MRIELLEKIRLSKKNIDLSHMAISDEEIGDISNTIVKLRPFCKQLFLNNNLIKDQGASLLAKQLIALKQLTYLDLQYNQISKHGLKSLTSLRHYSPHLILGLHGNIIRLVPETGEEATDEDDFLSFKQ